MSDNRTTELVSRREATTLLEEFLCGYQNILLSRGINASEAVCRQNELINEYAERIEQAIAATLGGGKLTAEQVREAIERHFGKVAVLDDGKPVEWRDDWVCKVAIDYRGIADELNAALGGGECEFSVVKESIPGIKLCGDICECGNCGYRCPYGLIEDERFKCCPGCGARMKAVKR